jgi:acetyltransferase-like isoleucine patch superfamily enzyme
VSKNVLRRLANRVLHQLARNLPGATSVRPFLHRLRGVSVGKGVFIADDVYLENEYPEAVEIHDGAQISVRAIIMAHTRGVGRIVIGKDAYVGPNSVVITSGGRLLTIGEGAVIGAAVVVNGNVAPHTFVANESARPVAKVRVPLATAETMEDFIRGLMPVRARTGSSAPRARSGT